ncbi:MAG: hypothetical protein LKJ80_04210 [Oscillibacter sp.]|jgi:hypothetical protein|nr:hypothetical protein [Oscillibacter sp.]
MLFQNDEASLKLEVLRYEFPADGGEPGSDDRNWLVLRGTYTEGGRIIVDSGAFLLTYELRELTAGLKVLNAGVRDSYESSFVEPYFELSAVGDDTGGFLVDTAFALPNTMEDVDAAELECRLSKAEMTELIGELDGLCARFPDRP